MATAQTIIDRSMRLLGQIGSGESPTTDETADCLIALNALLGTLRNDKLTCYAKQTESLTLVATQSSYTIGASGDLNTTRPVSIEEAYIVSGNISYPVYLLNEDQYAAIPDKTSTAEWPDRVLYRPSMATGTLLVHPVPTTAAVLKLVTPVVLAEFASAATTVTLPPGWEDMLAFNLAIAIAPEFETNPSIAIQSRATDSLAAIKRTNSAKKILSTGLEHLFGYGHSNILSDQA